MAEALRETRFPWKPVVVGKLVKELAAVAGCEPRPDALGNVQAGATVMELRGEALVVYTRAEADLADVHDVVFKHTLLVTTTPAAQVAEGAPPTSHGAPGS